MLVPEHSVPMVTIVLDRETIKTIRDAVKFVLRLTKGTRVYICVDVISSAEVLTCALD